MSLSRDLRRKELLADYQKAKDLAKSFYARGNMRAFKLAMKLVHSKRERLDKGEY